MLCCYVLSDLDMQILNLVSFGFIWPALSRLILHLARRSLRAVPRYGTATGATSGRRPVGSKGLINVD